MKDIRKFRLHISITWEGEVIETYGISDSKLLDRDRPIVRPTRCWSRGDKFRSFLLQFGVSAPLAHSLTRTHKLDLLIDTLQSDHTLFKLYETPDNKEKTLLNGACKCKRESSHGSIYARREKASECSKTDHKG